MRQEHLLRALSVTVSLLTSPHHLPSRGSPPPAPACAPGTFPGCLSLPCLPAYCVLDAWPPLGTVSLHQAQLGWCRQVHLVSPTLPLLAGPPQPGSAPLWASVALPVKGRGQTTLFQVSF